MNPHAAREIETERLRLRQWRETDFEPFRRLFGDEDLARYMGGHGDEAYCWSRLAAFAGNWSLVGHGFYALEEKAGGAFLGLCGVTRRFDLDAPELGWGLLREEQGKGYVTEAARAVRRHVYADLGWTSLVSCIDAGNTASIRVAERLGATYECELTARVRPCGLYRHPSPGQLRGAA
jgi:RimJ/RimL family protein N-acetyltransferase